ncbi:5-methylthioadenosine/S-adenosylhomocysteine deaminase [Sedimentisphaera cyanobacteriorum]|uniref:5-methylthioadenosine/S-adenosylhomocysteine deaminase n=1 Tax=Sedimentisphaera cyanobacteriorum TaxID=1940790 RepID=A0A1Q2HN20_9BACT|nr:amidohydrolase [Sedimentisphaera cyanobacteriorum]AQQ08842.1 5-methylthioadenosine/S-adenosylhomocysteine deaminase [Sedimentisphaera cyanobacteriorum]
MSSLLLKNAVLDQSLSNILIKDGIFKSLDAPAYSNADSVLDCTNLAVLPAFYNAHTHSPMTLLRGYADDRELFDWLQNYIWPMEAKFTLDDIIAGTRLACLEMIKTGTVFAADMYWHFPEVSRTITEMGLRCCAGPIFLDAFDDSLTKPQFEEAERFYNSLPSFSELLIPAIMPHSVYGAKESTLRKVSEMAKQLQYPIQIHVAETEKEVKDCQSETGLTPFEYLDSLGLLTEKTVSVHSVHMTDEDAELVKRRGAKIAHVPVSNMKLSSGAFRAGLFADYLDSICLGTDGCSSNNNLSMIEEMKFASLLAKHSFECTQIFSSEAVFKFATRNGAAAYGFDGGVIEKGRPADCILVDTKSPFMTPGYDIVSDIVYSCDSSCIDTVICNGEILMQAGKVNGEAEIIERARESARKITEK